MKNGTLKQINEINIISYTVIDNKINELGVIKQMNNIELTVILLIKKPLYEIVQKQYQILRSKSE